MIDVIETTSPTAGLADHHYPAVYRQVLGYVQHHEMTVLHADGLYRHVRFATPGKSIIGSFDLVTWPGYLTVAGDLGGGRTFRADEDMFVWFTNSYHGRSVPAGHINPGYWAEKMPGRRDYEGFSHERFTDYVNKLVERAVRQNHLTEVMARNLRSEVERDVLDEAHDATLAHQALARFTFSAGCGSPVEDLRLDPAIDPEAWDDYDHHYLLACHAILWGIRKYQQAEAHRTP